MAFQQKVLKECGRILLELHNAKNPEQTTNEREFEETLRERYNAYQTRKSDKSEEALPLHEFIALCCITAERPSGKPFLFEKTKLSFTIMCCNCEMSQEPLITFNSFQQWAPKLYPLATTYNYKRVFLALASEANKDNDNTTSSRSKPGTPTSDSTSSFGTRLRKRVTSSTSSNKSPPSTSNRTNNNTNKCIYGGISLSRFCGFVEELSSTHSIEQTECEGIKTTLEPHLRNPNERILYHIRGVSDLTGVPPYYGLVILTDYHLIFQGTALATRTTCIELSDRTLDIERAKIGGFLKRDTALRVCCASGTFTWNVVNMKSVRRDQLYWSVWSMMRAHQLADNAANIINEANNTSPSEISENSEILSKIRRKIILDASDDVLRQNAMQNFVGKDDNFDNVCFVRFATEHAQREYVIGVQKQLRDLESKLSKSSENSASIMTSILEYSSSFGASKSSSKLDTKKQSAEENIENVEARLGLRQYRELHRDFEAQKREESIARIESEEREDFDLKVFVKYIKVVRVELEPFVFAHRLGRCLVLWKNRGLTMFIVVCLQMVAWLDWVKYVPSLLCFCNVMFLVSMKNDREYTLGSCQRALLYAGFDPSKVDGEKLAAQKYASTKSNTKKSEEDKSGAGKWNFFDKIKNAQYEFYFLQFSMGFHQKKLAVLSRFLGKLRTLYKWNEVEMSQIYCLVWFGVGLLGLFVSLRVLFSVAVFAVFFKHSPFRSKKAIKSKGAVDRFFDAVPPDIPDVESDDEDDDDAASDDGGQNGVEEEDGDEDDGKHAMLDDHPSDSPSLTGMDVMKKMKQRVAEKVNQFAKSTSTGSAANSRKNSDESDA